MKLFLRFTLIGLLFLISTLSLEAQRFHGKRFYGDFFGGLTMSSMDMEGENAYKKGKVGFQVGANFKYRLDYNIEIQTGFYMIKKGSIKHEKHDKSAPGDEYTLLVTDIKTTVDANYMQVPLNIGFEVPLSRAKNIYFSAHAGLFGAYGFKGESKRKGHTGKASIDEEGRRGKLFDALYYDEKSKTFTNSNLKRWDYGFNANAGLVFDMFILQLQYDHGWANVATDSQGEKWKTRNYSLSLGFRF